MRIAQVRIDRSEHHSTNLFVGAWEIPLLQFEFSPEKVVIVEFKVQRNRPYPNPENEFERLRLRYGTDTDTGNDKAAVVYGQGVMGVMAVARLIEREAKLELTEEVKELDLVQNVVPNPEAVKIIEANPIPGEAEAKAAQAAQSAELTALLRESQAANKANAEVLTAALAQIALMNDMIMRLQAPAAPAAAESRPTLSVKAK